MLAILLGIRDARTHTHTDITVHAHRYIKMWCLITEENTFVMWVAMKFIVF